MGEDVGNISLDQMRDLLAYLEVDTLEQAGEVVGEHTDPDVSIVEEGGEYVVRMATQGSVLEFPTTVDDFWDLVRDLEDDVATVLETDLEEDL